LVPADALGPGADEAGVGFYIIRRLEDRPVSLAGRYRRGLAELDDIARRRDARSFSELPHPDQDRLLAAVEAGELGHELSCFFADLHRHAMDGMFGDPAHGGNANRCGWTPLVLCIA
jgi:gluconate 2-dehydrogenase gamma chain